MATKKPAAPRRASARSRTAAKKVSAKKVSPKKTLVAAAKPVVSTSVAKRAGPRKIKQRHYRHFRLQKSIKHPDGKLTGSFRLMWRAALQLKRNWKLMGGIMLIYGALTIVFVRGFGGGMDLGTIRASLRESLGGGASEVSTSIGLFSVLLGSAGNTSSEVAGAYQSFLIVIGSMVIIWALRQVHADGKPGVLDAYYRGPSQLVPFLSVLFVIAVQLIPALIGAGVYGTVVSNGLALTTAEKGMSLVFFIFMSLLSIYMLSSSLFALYIVTLPGVRPMKALRSARKLVLYRRWELIRKILFLPIAMLVLSAIIMVPIILIATPVAEWLFFVVSLLALALAHSYMYLIYRELI